MFWNKELVRNIPHRFGSPHNGLCRRWLSSEFPSGCASFRSNEFFDPAPAFTGEKVRGLALGERQAVRVKGDAPPCHG